ncbi:MAG: hypothetical protein AVDCRST_MAG64-170 [uncultured Phycisphaerae bacterium]|uniref:Uncharacterized protein n=1 Tax=uncultured Phycisphaerae bacterium TaxID=904963 RepID=A0A6J4MXJ9_9BACT|nr:MAG: hypothetical protein AVDCRST_MAG64-170 [uncultured Phycisphaerae bacterium]
MFGPALRSRIAGFLFLCRPWFFVLGSSWSAPCGRGPAANDKRRMTKDR